MSLDITSIVYSLIFAELLFIAIFAITQSRHPQTQGPRYWALGCATNAWAIATISTDGTIPSAEIVLLGNTLFFSSLFFHWQGIRSFFNLPTHKRAMAMTLLALVLVQAAFIYLWPSASARKIIQSTLAFAFLCLMLRDIQRQRRNAIQFECNVLTTLFLLAVLLHLVRINHTIRHFYDGFPYVLDPAYSYFLFGYFVLTVAQLPILVLLITNQIDDQRKKALASLSESEHIFRNLFEGCSDPICLIKEGRFIGCNNAALALFGYQTRAEVLNLHPSQISPPFQPDGQPSAEKADEMIRLALSKGSNRFEWLHTRSDGSPIPVEVTLTPIPIDGEIFLHTNIRDISERKIVEESLRYSELKLRTIYDSTNDAILLQDENGFFDCNQSAVKLFGCTSLDELHAKHPAELSPPEQPCGMDSITLANEHIAQAEKTGKESFEWQHRRCDDGTCFPAEVRLSIMVLGGRPVIQAVVRDISERKMAEEAIRQLAFYDHLTALPNRRLLLDRLKIAMAQATRNKTLLAFLAIDLDRFKPVNDNHGHDIGDQLLMAVAARIQGCLRQSDTVSRIGGDEFVVLLPDLHSMADGLLAAHKIRQALNQPFALEGGYNVAISSSSGIAFYPEHGETDTQLAKNADIAMYRAKALGRNTVEVYSPDQSKHIAIAS